LSLECCVVIKDNCTAVSSLDFSDVYIRIKKQDSPSANPTNQYGSGIPEKTTLGLGIGTVLGKIFFNDQINHDLNELLN